MDKTMIMEKYLPYKGLWWKITPPTSENDTPMWRISEDEDDRMCRVWMFNAFTFSLEDCYASIKTKELMNQIEHLQIENTALYFEEISKILPAPKNPTPCRRGIPSDTYIPIKGEYIIGADVANGYESDYAASLLYLRKDDIYELLSVRSYTPKYMGRGFFKVGHIFTNSNGIHLLSKLPSNMTEKTYIRYEEKPKSLDVMYKVICKKLEKFFKNGK